MGVHFGKDSNCTPTSWFRLTRPACRSRSPIASPTDCALSVGDAVVVPFGSQSAVGHVVALKDECPAEMQAKIKPIASRIENGAAFDASLYDLAQWVAEQTLCDLRDAVRLIAPEIMASQIKTTLRLAEDWEERLAGTRSVPQRDTATALASLGGETEPAKLAKALGQPKVGPALAELRKKGVVAEERTVRLPPARRKVVRLLRLAVAAGVAGEEAARLEQVGRDPAGASAARPHGDGHGGQFAPLGGSCRRPDRRRRRPRPGREGPGGLL